MAMSNNIVMNNTPAVAPAARPIDYTGSALNPQSSSAGNPWTQGNTSGNGAVLSPLYQPPQPGGQTATTPVVTANSAQTDYLAKWNAYRQITDAISNQNAQKATQAQMDEAAKSQKELQASETNLKQQGIDIQKTQALAQQQEAQNKADALKMASAPDSDTPAPTAPGTTGTPAATGTAQPTAPQTTADVANNGIQTATSQFQQGTANILDQRNTLSSNMLTSLNQVLQGTIPLSGPQQALITSLQTQLSQNETLQKLSNESQVGAAKMAAFRSGGEYSPQEAANSVANIVAQGTMRVQELDNSAAKTIAEMEISFQKQDFDIINRQYDVLSKQLDNKDSAIKDTYSATVKALQDMRDAELKQKEFDHTVLKDTQALNQSKFEFRDLKDEFGQTIGTQVFDKGTGKVVSSTSAGVPGTISDPSTGTLSPVQLDGFGKPNADQQAAFLQTLPPAYRDLVKQMAEYRSAPPKNTSKDKKLGEWVAQYDPTFDATKYAERQAYMKSMGSGPLQQGVAAANKVINHLTSFADTSSQIPGRGAINFLGLNKPAGAVLEGGMAMLGMSGPQEAQAQAEQQARGLSDEMAKFFKGTGSTDVESIKGWSGSLNPNASPGTQHGVIQGSLDLFSGQLNTMLQQYQSTMGKAAPLGAIIQPETMQKLSAFKDAGYNVDIPGVPYTDPTAYVNASPDNRQTLSEVRQKFPELSPAQALQVAQYNQ